MTPSPPADELYSLPLDEFIDARDELVRRLRAAGEKQAAAGVKSLRKPTLPAWAVNQLARREADSIRRLLEIRDEIARGGGARDLRRLSNERRGVMGYLVERAEQILEEGGHSASAATLDEVSKTLQAGGDADERDRLERGVLDRPLDPSGFEGLAGFPAAAESEPVQRPSAAQRRKAEERAADADRAEREAADARAEADAAQRAAEEARARAESAARRAEKLRAKADEALEELGS